MSNNKLETVEITHGQNNPTHSVIWLHGLGADAQDFVPMVPEFRLSAALNIRFVFPNAPVMPVTINNGYEMRAWYDIESLAINQRVDQLGITRSISLIHQLIEHEIQRGISPQHIFLAGFSQGAVMALRTGLSYSKPLAGIIALSGYLPLADDLTHEQYHINRNIPIFVGHGIEDTVVPFAIGQWTANILRTANYAISWHNYPIAHSVSATEIHDISMWLQARINQK